MHVVYNNNNLSSGVLNYVCSMCFVYTLYSIHSSKCIYLTKATTTKNIFMEHWKWKSVGRVILCNVECFSNTFYRYFYHVPHVLT